MANNTLIGAIRAEATLESGKFVDGAKKIRKEAKTTEVQVKSSFSAMGTAVKGFGGALTAGLSIGLLGGLAKKALDFATSIKDVAKQVGVTTKELQEFRYAAAQMGIKQTEADKGLEKLSLTMGKAAAGSKTATNALAAVGVTLKDIQTKSKAQIFGQIADQMIKQGGAAKNAAAANAVFGGSSAKLNPLLDQGSQGLNELTAAANRLGVVLSDSAINQADETARKLDDVRRVLSAQIAGVVAENASSIVTLAQSLSTLTGEIVKFMGSNPQAALAIIGALAGSRFGLPGAAAGAVAGAYAGSGMQAQADQRKLQGNTGLLRHNLQQQRAAIQRKRAAGQGVTVGELNRLRSLTNKLTGGAPSAGFGTAPIPDFLASAPKAGPKGRTPRAPRDRSDDVSFQFDQELRRAQLDVLRAQQSLARTSDERAAIALKLLDADRKMQEAELNDRVRRAERDFAEGKITASALEQAKAQAVKLRAEYDQADALQRKAIADDLAAEKAENAAALVDSNYDLRLEQLQAEASLAETASERRAAELRILALMKEQERARLKAVIADQKSSELAKAQARQRLGALDTIYAGRADVAKQGTRGPYEDWMSSLPTSAEKMQKAFEQLQVQGFDGLIDAALALTDGFDSAKEALLNTLKQFFLGLAKAQLQSALGSLLPASGFQLPKFAGGGGFNVRGIPGVDRNTLSLNGIPIANVSYGERLSVSNDNSRTAGGGRSLVQNFNFPNSDADSFRRSEGQVARAARRRLGHI